MRSPGATVRTGSGSRSVRSSRTDTGTQPCGHAVKNFHSMQENRVFDSVAFVIVIAFTCDTIASTSKQSVKGQLGRRLHVWTRRQGWLGPGDSFCPLSARAASKFVVESLVFGSQPGNLFAVDVDLLPKGLEGC